MNLVKRLTAPSPKFFTVLRNIGLALAAVGGTILAAPVALPVAVSAVGGYLAIAGGVLSAVSQLTTAGEEARNPPEQVVPTAVVQARRKTVPKAGLGSLPSPKPGQDEGRTGKGKAQLGTGAAQPDKAFDKVPDEHW